MEEDNEIGIIHPIYNYPFTLIDNNIILNKNIDFYTLGVYVKFKYLIEHGEDLDSLNQLGKLEYIEKAIEKLKRENYIEEVD